MKRLYMIDMEDNGPTRRYGVYRRTRVWLVYRRWDYIGRFESLEQARDFVIEAMKFPIYFEEGVK